MTNYMENCCKLRYYGSKFTLRIWNVYKLYHSVLYFKLANFVFCCSFVSRRALWTGYFTFA